MMISPNEITYRFLVSWRGHSGIDNAWIIKNELLLEHIEQQLSNLSIKAPLRLHISDAFRLDLDSLVAPLDRVEFFIVEKNDVEKDTN